MTYRARAIAFLGLLGLFFGTVREQPVLSLISFSAVSWVLLEWLRFRTRVRFELPRLRFERLIIDRKEATGTLWAGRTIRIALQVQSSSPIKSMIEVRDMVSEILDISSPTAEVSDTQLKSSVVQPKWKRWLLAGATSVMRWAATEPEAHPPNYGRFELGARRIEISYAAQLRAAGRIAFPGVRLTIHDEYGLFQLHRVINLEQSFRILPKYFPSGELRPTVKRYNSLPRHGIHRLERSGMGSELLELREYVVGDPPK